MATATTIDERKLRLYSYIQGGYALVEIIERESGFNPKAQNPNSTAFGTMQFLDSTWELANCEKTDDPYEQIDCGVTYIKVAYGTPEKALRFHDENGWY